MRLSCSLWRHRNVTQDSQAGADRTPRNQTASPSWPGGEPIKVEYNNIYLILKVIKFQISPPLSLTGAQWLHSNVIYPFTLLSYYGTYHGVGRKITSPTFIMTFSHIPPLYHILRVLWMSFRYDPFNVFICMSFRIPFNTNVKWDTKRHVFKWFQMAT